MHIRGHCRPPWHWAEPPRVTPLWPANRGSNVPADQKWDGEAKCTGFRRRALPGPPHLGCGWKWLPAARVASPRTRSS